jgi:hypothetical protein
MRPLFDALLIICLCLFVAFVINFVGNQPTEEKKSIQAVTTTLVTNSYEEIGWRRVMAIVRDTESQCSYVVVSMNNTTNPSTFARCWVGGDNISVKAVLRDCGQEKQAYVLKLNTGVSAYPAFVVKWNAKSTRADH